MSQTGAFEVLGSRLGLGPKSRAAYVAIDLGLREPTESEQRVLAEWLGGYPVDMAEPGTNGATPEVPGLADLIARLDRQADLVSALGAFFLVGWGVTAHPRGQWTLLAGMSYALYLWHVDLIEILGPVGLAASFAVALVSYVALEAPVMGLLRHRRPERDDEKRDGRWRWRGRIVGHDNVDVRA